MYDDQEYQRYLERQAREWRFVRNVAIVIAFLSFVSAMFFTLQLLRFLGVV